jgi:hypothetical protein
MLMGWRGPWRLAIQTVVLIAQMKNQAKLIINAKPLALAPARGPMRPRRPWLSPTGLCAGFDLGDPAGCLSSRLRFRCRGFPSHRDAPAVGTSTGAHDLTAVLRQPQVQPAGEGSQFCG